MTPEQIREKRIELEGARKIQRARHQAEVMHLNSDFAMLIAQCQHPDQHTRSVMGENEQYCPDCGRQQ